MRALPYGKEETENETVTSRAPQDEELYLRLRHREQIELR